MALFFLEYDLRKTRDYSRLTDELAKFGALRILQSSWCFRRFNTTPEVLRDHFRYFIDNDDGLSISEVEKWATYGTLSNPNKLA
jgi:hypothetical protein